MTVGTLLRTISSLELAEWQAEDQIRADERADAEEEAGYR